MTRNKPWGRGIGDGRREKKVWNCHPGEWEYTEDGKGCAYGDSPQHPSPPWEWLCIRSKRPCFSQLCSAVPTRVWKRQKARLTTLWLFPCEMAGRKSMRRDRMQGTKRLLRKRGLGDMVMKDFRSWRPRRPLEWTDLLGRQEAKL